MAVTRGIQQDARFREIASPETTQSPSREKREGSLSFRSYHCMSLGIGLVVARSRWVGQVVGETGLRRRQWPATSRGAIRCRRVQRLAAGPQQGRARYRGRGASRNASRSVVRATSSVRAPNALAGRFRPCRGCIFLAAQQATCCGGGGSPRWPRSASSIGRSPRSLPREPGLPSSMSGGPTTRALASAAGARRGKSKPPPRACRSAAGVSE